MRDVLRWALPTSMALSLVALTTALATGMFPQLWSRGVPSLLLLGFSLVAAWLTRVNRLLGAVAALMSGLGLVVIIALTFNGGVRAPAAMILFFLVALCGWVFGRRAATAMAILSSAVLTVYFVLGTTGVLSEPSLVPLAGEYVMLMAMTVLLWGTSASPPNRLREALVDGLVREQQLRDEQAARLEAARRFQAVFDQTPHLMGLLTPDGRVESINRAALEFAGITADQVLGRAFDTTPWWPAPAQAGTALITRAHEGVVRFESTSLDAKRRVRTVDFSLSPFRDERGDLRFLIAEGRDVTELMLDRERRHTTQRLELVGQLAGGVAHDFNNVLMAILSSAEVLRFELGTPANDPKETREQLDTIIEVSKRAGELTQRLLSFSRRTPLERRAVSLQALLESTAKLLRRTLPANLRLVVQAGADEQRVQGDEAALESALLNLALNARDAMPDGGELTFSSDRVELTDDWCRASGFEVQPGPALRLTVRDTGCGIAPENLQRVFEPFFTTKGEGKGTGLGLASVYGVVREHGGAVHLESELGKGTVVHLTLPLAEAPLTPASSPPVALEFPGLQVLIVDDEPAIRRMLARLLRPLGVVCTLVGSAEEGLAAFDPRMKLIITDVVLPGRRGNELAAELLTRHPQLSAILISGFPKDSDLSTLPPERVRLLGKPFTFESLERALGELVG